MTVILCLQSDEHVKICLCLCQENRGPAICQALTGHPDSGFGFLWGSAKSLGQMLSSEVLLYIGKLEMIHTGVDVMSQPFRVFV
jgi:hypothetical protein